MTIYFLSVIRSSSSDKSQHARSFSRVSPRSFLFVYLSGFAYLSCRIFSTFSWSETADYAETFRRANSWKNSRVETTLGRANVDKVLWIFFRKKLLHEKFQWLLPLCFFFFFFLQIKITKLLKKLVSKSHWRKGLSSQGLFEIKNSHWRTNGNITCKKIAYDFLAISAIQLLLVNIWNSHWKNRFL